MQRGRVVAGIVLGIICLSVLGQLPVLSQQTHVKRTDAVAANSRAEEQTEFSVEGDIHRPVPLPDQVLALLRKDDATLGRRENLDPNKIPAPWFAASEIDLNGDALPDLVVIATEPSLWGAHVGPFWVFRQTASGYERALGVRADGISVEKRKRKGHRDVHVFHLSAGAVTTSVFRFDGKAYQQSGSSTASLK